jgi:hypothetical protein
LTFETEEIFLAILRKLCRIFSIGRGIARWAPNLIYPKGYGTQIGHETRKVKHVLCITTVTSSNKKIAKKISEKRKRKIAR